MERVERFTERDVLSNKYTILNNKLIITHTKSLDEYMQEISTAIYKYLSTKDSRLSDFI